MQFAELLGAPGALIEYLKKKGKDRDGRAIDPPGVVRLPNSKRASVLASDWLVTYVPVPPAGRDDAPYRPSGRGDHKRPGLRSGYIYAPRPRPAA